MRAAKHTEIKFLFKISSLRPVFKKAAAKKIEFSIVIKRMFF